MDGACGATAEALNLVPRLRSLGGDQSLAFDLVVTHTFGGEHRSEPRVGASVRLPARNARPGVLGPRLQRFDGTDRWPVYAALFNSQVLALRTPSRGDGCSRGCKPPDLAAIRPVPIRGRRSQPPPIGLHNQDLVPSGSVFFDPARPVGVAVRSRGLAPPATAFSPHSGRHGSDYVWSAAVNPSRRTGRQLRGNSR